MSRPPQSRHWCFTINNPSLVDPPDISLITYIIAGYEIGDQGTPHLQGYVIFKTKKRLTQVKKIMPRAHLEMKQGTPEQAAHYCMKPVLDCTCKHCIKAKDQIPNYSEYGTIPISAVGGEMEIQRWNDAYESALKGNFDEIPKDMLIRCYHNFKRIHQDNPSIPNTLEKLDNVWIIAPTRYGKSWYARHKYPDFYDKPPNKWFVGYQGQSTILCDDFGPDQCKYLCWYLKRWADIYPFPIETKGGGKDIRPKHIIITSQYTIDESFEDQRMVDAIKERFRVLCIPHWKTGKLPPEQVMITVPHGFKVRSPNYIDPPPTF